ncbi:MAG TPA: amidohydrolase family protein [Tepidisphaeraceae bacterium]|jgi:predicted TIM-barrel fold metal-dependent hydrolase
MIVDCHVHICAATPAHGSMSPRLLNSIPFRFMRWHFGLAGNDAATERELEKIAARTIDETPGLDAAVMLAFDAVHTPDGYLDAENTHLYVKNDYVIELAGRYPKMLFGASIHPYRKDAVAELERCVAAGAVLMKWLPIVQNFDPASERCIPFYEALAHHRLPLLSHTGGEQSLPSLDKSVASPMLLEPALRRGVTVIAAHCGTRSKPGETSYLQEFVQLAHRYENFYGDTSALNLPARWYAFDTILKDKVVRDKLVHGSDWPIISLPSPSRVGWSNVWELMAEANWMRRDVLIKRQLAFDDAYWHRAATLLRIAK